MAKLTVAWLSAGVSSFIATYLMREEIDEFYYIDIDDQHPDSMRFIKDCEKVLGKPIKILKSLYGSVENAIRAGGLMRCARTGYAFCTDWLKKRVRKEQFEYYHQNDEVTYVWGFDCSERNRAERLFESMPKFSHRFPLIEQSLTKQDCHEITYQGETHTIAEWARITGISENALYNRVNRNWDLDRIFSQKVRGSRV